LLRYLLKNRVIDDARQQGAKTTMNLITAQRYERLKTIVTDMGSVLVAFSGGVDSTLVLKVAHDVLGERAVAATGESDSLAEVEGLDAAALAQEMGARHIVIRTDEMNDPRYLANDRNRCFWCKTELFTKLNEVAAREGLAWVVDGNNADDLGDHRPGMAAGHGLGARSPLQEAGLTKSDIRAIAHHLELRVWDKPAAPCLSSRIAYGQAVTPEKLRQIGQAEAYLRQLGLREFRVRHHDQIARIEVRPDDLTLIVAEREMIVARFKELGFGYVTLDLQGFRSGSLNEVRHEDLIQIGVRRPRTL
jgi:uncharacterized protein